MKAFAAKGSAFSMDELADLAGVSKQAIYRRWRSKIDLVVEAIESVLTQGLEPDPAAPTDPVAKLRDLAWRHFSDERAVSNRLAIYLQLESLGNMRLREQLLQWRAQFVEVYKRALQVIDSAGRRADGDIGAQAETLLELLNGGRQKLALAGPVQAADQQQCFEQRWTMFRRVALC